MSYGEMLLSAILEQNVVGALYKFNVNKTDFLTKVEQDAYTFICDYAQLNGGNAPDWRTVTANVPDFDYRRDVTDSFEYMVNQLKLDKLHVLQHQYLSQNLSKMFAEKNPVKLVDELTKQLNDMVMGIGLNKKVGIDFVKDVGNGLQEYERRKQGISFKVWKSKFPSVNKILGGGGYMSGDMYTWYGRSGRGKSLFVMEEAIESALQGATVLLWLMELSEYTAWVRLLTSVSARHGILSHKHVDEETKASTTFNAGLPARDLLTAQLTEENYNLMLSYVKKLNENIKGKIIMRCVNHSDFVDKSVTQLRKDIEATNADVVVIDPIYYMSYEVNTSKTAGGDASATSTKLRLLAGYKNIVLHVITQAEETKIDRDEQGNRQLERPERDGIKKTKQVLEDASEVISIDSAGSRAKMWFGKGRSGGEDESVDIVFLPNHGIIEEQCLNEQAFYLSNDTTAKPINTSLPWANE